MSAERRNRVRVIGAPGLVLPPPFRAVRLREVGDAFASARAQAGERGAGTLFFVGRFDLAEFAVVLEPEEPLASARRTAFYVGMVALADALSALAPPEKPIAITWPDTLSVDGGAVGGGRLGWPDQASEHEPPDWLVFGAMIRTVSIADEEAGLRPLVTALEEEGFENAGSEQLIEGFARHLMAAMNREQEGGFETIAREYAARLGDADGGGTIEANGDLVLHAGKTPVRRPLASALSAPAWRDPVTGGPRA
jgi:biotin-(acetyl-CoA carboxylase) ligase